MAERIIVTEAGDDLFFVNCDKTTGKVNALLIIEKGTVARLRANGHAGVVDIKPLPPEVYWRYSPLMPNVQEVIELRED